MKYKKRAAVGLLLLLSMMSLVVCAHGVDDKTKSFLLANEGVAFGPFLYIGAKHMLTGYDHLLFLLGVIFFLYRTKDILVYVSFFTLGHSFTLLLGVLTNMSINAHLVDAVIGFSVVYKGFDNLGGFQTLFGVQPDTKIAVLVFGLFHGFGLAAKLQEFNIGKEGLLTNLIGFNLGVEIGQFLALIFVLLLLRIWRNYESFQRFATVTNTLLMAAGFVLIAYQLTGYFLQ